MNCYHESTYVTLALTGNYRGTTEPECVRVDLKEYSEYIERWTIETRYYTDSSTEEYEEYDSQAEADSYTTGFVQDSGEFCDVFSVRAYTALQADDTVQYLDCVAHDPTKRFQERSDAAQLLSWHIWPDPSDSQNEFELLDRNDIELSEWDRRIKNDPMCLPMECVNNECTEGECLSDLDTLREEERAVCMVCGTEQPIPEYP